PRRHRGRGPKREREPGLTSARPVSGKGTGRSHARSPGPARQLRTADGRLSPVLRWHPGAGGTLASVKALQRLLLALIAVLALDGCVRVTGDVSISEEDTLSGEVTVAIDREWLITQGEDPDALITGIQEDLENAPEEGVTGEPY